MRRKQQKEAKKQPIVEKKGAITLDLIGKSEQLISPEKKLDGNKKFKEQALSISRKTKDAIEEVNKLNERFEMDTVFPFLIPNQAVLKDLDERKKQVQKHQSHQILDH